MSPEQLRGDEVDFRSDLYSLGIVAFELFTGALPFRGDTPVATIVRQLHDAPNLDLPALPEALRPVLARALAKDPADRFPTAEEMHDALTRACEAALPGVVRLHDRLHAADAPDDRTRPVTAGALPEGVPLLWMVIGQAALAALAVHLVSAGGPAPAPNPPPPRVVTVAPAPSPPAPAPSAALAARPATRRPAPQPTAVPTPLPAAAGAPSLVHTLPTSPAPRSLVDTARVYEEDEVETKPRLVVGMNAPYPAWGPKLGKGQSVSITASYVVTEEGLVTDIRVERGGGVLEAVLLEISRWRYEPGRIRGVPVKVRLRWKHTFIGG
jgi:serine/threonine-protein kinase